MAIYPPTHAPTHPYMHPLDLYCCHLPTHPYMHPLGLYCCCSSPLQITAMSCHALGRDVVLSLHTANILYHTRSCMFTEEEDLSAALLPSPGIYDVGPPITPPPQPPPVPAWHIGTPVRSLYIPWLASGPEPLRPFR